MTKKFTVAEFVRKIQQLAALPSPTDKEKTELWFYLEVLKAMSELDIRNLVPLKITCPIEDVQEWAKPLDMHIVEGVSGTMYLSWSKGLDVE